MAKQNTHGCNKLIKTKLIDIQVNIKTKYLFMHYNRIDLVFLPRFVYRLLKPERQAIMVMQ